MRVIITFILLIVYTNIIFASNASYISLSNQRARKIQLGVVSNNAANSSTYGYEADNIHFKNIDIINSKTEKNSFVYANGMYKNAAKGDLKVTNRPLDVAIISDGYFKILTPNGDRYTLNGSIFVNNEYILVNSHGLAFANQNNEPILIPENVIDITITEDGALYADGILIDILGVFVFEDVNQLVKEGNNLYRSLIADRVVQDDVRIVSGSLRASNVNSINAISSMVELQKSIDSSSSLMSKITELEKSTIHKITK